MSEVIGEVAPQHKARVVAISGPTFAREVVKEFPTALVAACEDTELAKIVQSEFSAPSFRVYTNNDIVGVELGGAVKNVIAIASGVGAGLGLGHNSLAALVTRGLAEISRLSEAMGGRRDTLSGLAGMGDLFLTCTAELSRNRSVGYELGRGRPLNEILSSMRMIAEGVPTTHAAVTLAERHNVEMPITFQMARLLRDETTPREAIHELMSRPLREE
jgi:glycerol-3-phosphate dehydrogenase (NAD(P)+)